MVLQLLVRRRDAILWSLSGSPLRRDVYRQLLLSRKDRFLIVADEVRSRDRRNPAAFEPPARVGLEGDLRWADREWQLHQR